MTEMCDVRVMKGWATRSKGVKRFRAAHTVYSAYVSSMSPHRRQT